MKKIILIVTCILLINFMVVPVYANTDTEEAELTQEELNQILETASSLEKAPNINSRHAIIYDRVSRRNHIWEEGK